MTHAEDTGRIDVDAYLERLGVDETDVTPESADSDVESLGRLQAAHVERVPFENLAIVGDPHGDREGDGVYLDTAHLYEKVVERGRGGYCYELNGLFHALLDQFGYDVDRVAARVVSGGGDATPANHHANVVHLDEPVVVDVGMGTPPMRRPTPLDGTEVTGPTGVTWRIAESDRPDEKYRTEYREPHTAEWSTRYVFDHTPRSLSYFAATNDYLQTSPDSPFTENAIVSVATPEGYRRLSPDTYREVTFVDGDGGTEKSTRERTIDPANWHDVLREQFHANYDRDASGGHRPQDG